MGSAKSSTNLYVRKFSELGLYFILLMDFRVSETNNVANELGSCRLSYSRLFFLSYPELIALVIDCIAGA